MMLNEMTDAQIIELHKAVRFLPAEWKPEKYRRRGYAAINGPRMFITDLEGTALARCVQLVIDETKVSHRDMMTATSDRTSVRARRNASARQLAMWLCRKVTKLSLPKIGRFFNRDHATVVHSLKRVEWDLSVSPTMGLRVARLVAASDGV